MSSRPWFTATSRCNRQVAVVSDDFQTALQNGGTMHWKIERHLVFWGFALAAAILVIAGWESYRNTVRFSEASEWRKHTYEVLRNIDARVAELLDAETGPQGYLLTGGRATL